MPKSEIVTKDAPAPRKPVMPAPYQPVFLPHGAAQEAAPETAQIPAPRTESPVSQVKPYEPVIVDAAAATVDDPATGAEPVDAEVDEGVEQHVEQDTDEPGPADPAGEVSEVAEPPQSAVAVGEAQATAEQAMAAGEPAAPSEPEPVAEAPSAPEPVAEAVGEPEPVADALTQPEAAQPEPVAEAPSAPEPVAEAPSEPEPVAEAPSEPEAAQPEPVAEAPSEPEPVAEPVAEAPSEPEPVAEAPTQPEAAQPQPAAEAAVEPEATDPQPAQPAPVAETQPPVTEQPDAAPHPSQEEPPVTNEPVASTAIAATAPAPAPAPAAAAPAPAAPAPAAAAAPPAAPQGPPPVEALSVIPFLRALSELSGSDLHCKVGSPPRIRIDGRLRRVRSRDLVASDTEAMLDEVIRPDLIDDFAKYSEADFGFSLAGVGRFRVNAYRARGSVGLVFRRVSVGAVPLSELGVPEVIASLALEPRGLVLVTGPTGSGKTTTLAGMVDHINSTKEVHIVTIEDPIEVLHHDKSSMINQREVGLDTRNFAVALRAAMRQDPDVVLVGEMRDAETVGAALSASETGHFVMSTLHTTDAAETITRVIDFFPPHEQKQTRLSLSAALKGIVCQRLVPRADGRGRVVVMEICVNNGRIADAIADPEKTHMITELIKEGGFYGMQTFDQHLVSLFRDHVVTLEDAMHASSNPHDLQVELRAQGLI
jgi:twitching motility protein PilT